MERGVIEVDSRHTVRRMRTAMQGDVIRALVELITNSDDSYRELEDKGSGLIEIIYKKDSYRGIFAVRDMAEGMSIEDVRNGFKKYGAATSGFKEGKKVRGYFGQGAKDALCGMKDGRICTFNDDKFLECRLFIENGQPKYEIDDPIPSIPELRARHEINGNGTIAYFVADPQKGCKVPRFDTVHTELANNYLLRKIMTNPKRKVVLIDEDRGIRRHLRYQMPKGREILTDDFKVSYGDYGEFSIHISLWRAEGELSQIGDDRAGGLLIVDDEDVVLGISLFKYDNEPLAARFFGEVVIGQFRELLKKEEPVLCEERDGLIPRHPFCQTLIPEIEKRIEIKIKEEKIRRQKEAQSEIDREETIRYKNAFSILNRIAEVEAEAVTNLGQDPTTDPEPPPDGFCIYPSSAQITVGKRYAFELRLDTNVVRHGSIIKITCTHPRIHVVTPVIKVTPEDSMGIVRKYITIKGDEPNINGTLWAISGTRATKAGVYVVPEKEILLSEGMVFQPEMLTLQPNQPRKVYLLVYVKIIEGGSRIVLSKDNDSIHISKEKEEIIVNEADAVRHVAKYELEVWGEGDGQDAMITAECEPYMALLQVRVRLKEPPGEGNGKGMFSEPEFNHEEEPLQRASYSPETGKVIIYVNFPSVLHYLGEDCHYRNHYRKTLPAQVLIADLVAEKCFYEIARKKVQSSGVTLSPEAVKDRIQRDALVLSQKYGAKVHEALVDQKLLQEAKWAAEDQNV